MCNEVNLIHVFLGVIGIALACFALAWWITELENEDTSLRGQGYPEVSRERLILTKDDGYLLGPRVGKRTRR